MEDESAETTAQLRQKALELFREDEIDLPKVNTDGDVPVRADAFLHGNGKMVAQQLPAEGFHETLHVLIVGKQCVAAY